MAKVNTKRLSQVSTSSAFESCVDFDSKEDTKTKEVNELKARIAQMEKSMRWWNQCANNWRLKWTDVRNERNKLKDECRSMKNKLEDFESNYCSMETELEKLRTQRAIECVKEHACCQRSLMDFNVNNCFAAAEPLQMESTHLNSDINDMPSLIEQSVKPSNVSFNSLLQNEADIRTNIITSMIDASTDTNDYSKTHLDAFTCETVDCERLSDLKQAHSQLKKVLQEKCLELTNALRKVDTYENEIKKLRLRTDELKKELIVAEDHVENASNTIRKLQRNNDKLQEQVNDFRVAMQPNVRRDEYQELNVNAIEQ